MSRITQRHLPDDVLRAKVLDDNGFISPQWHRFFSLLIQGLPVLQSTEVTLDPGSVSANTTSTETVTFSGVTTNDLIVVNKPTHDTGLVVTAFTDTADQAKIIFMNTTGSPINPGPESYKLYAVRL